MNERVRLALHQLLGLIGNLPEGGDRSNLQETIETLLDPRRSETTALADFPEAIASKAEEYYVADDAVFQLSRACQKIEDQTRAMIVAQRAKDSDRPLYGSDEARKVATKGALKESYDYAQQREKLQSVANMRNALAIELEELRGEFEVRRIAAWREIASGKALPWSDVKGQAQR